MDNTSITTASILLDEMRKLRDDIADWKAELGQRVAVLETVVKPALMNNGQPALIVQIEGRVSALEKLAAKVIAGGAVVWTLITLALHFLPGGEHGR